MYLNQCKRITFINKNKVKNICIINCLKLLHFIGFDKQNVCKLLLKKYKMWKESRPLWVDRVLLYQHITLILQLIFWYKSNKKQSKHFIRVARSSERHYVSDCSTSTSLYTHYLFCRFFLLINTFLHWYLGNWYFKTFAATSREGKLKLTNPTRQSNAITIII